MANMIFHHPLPIWDGGDSGSKVRPVKMVEAFINIGYNVDTVSGYGYERKKAINRIRKAVEQGKQYDFIYSESSTMPTALTEVHHYPVYPLLDFGFFKWARNNSIPVGLFYRDVYWRFRHYKNNVNLFKRAVTIPFYKYDWLHYKRLVDHLFLPSLKIQSVLPSSWNKTISALPPGCHIKSPDIDQRVHNKSDRNSNSKLRLFYVGGVTPPVYNLRPLFQTISGLKNLHLTLCCRNKEWDIARDLYVDNERENLNIIHLSGAGLQNCYEKMDIFALLWGPYEYTDLAMPVKVFESIGNGLPVLTFAGSEISRFIQREGVGWVINTVDEAKTLLNHLSKNRFLIEEKKHSVLKVRENHTWEVRANTVAKMLIKPKGSHVI